MLVCHRRMGKTVFAIQKLIRDVLACDKERPRGHYFAPTLKQARSIAWDYLQHFTRYIPNMKYNKVELSADFPSGQRIQLVGGSSVDSYRGQYSDSCVMDELAQMPPRLWSEVVRPALADRTGDALFIGTPMGRNAFYDMYERAGELDDWGRCLLTVEDTKLIPESELRQLRKEMEDYEYQQEFMCSWQAAVRGAFYGKVMNEAEDSGRITDVPYDPALPVYTSCDLGIADAFAVVFWQVSPGGQYRCIDYEEYHNMSLPEVIGEMRKKPYERYETHIAPHDIKVRELGSGSSRLEIAQQNGIRYHMARNLPLMDGIDATRNLIRKAWFDKTNCKLLINHLQLYRADVIEATGVLSHRPRHDHTSHGADAVRYFAVEMGSSNGQSWGSGINYDMLDRMAI